MKLVEGLALGAGGLLLWQLWRSHQQSQGVTGGDDGALPPPLPDGGSFDPHGNYTLPDGSIYVGSPPPAHGASDGDLPPPIPVGPGAQPAQPLNTNPGIPANLKADVSSPAIRYATPQAGASPSTPRVRL